MLVLEVKNGLAGGRISSRVLPEAARLPPLEFTQNCPRQIPIPQTTPCPAQESAAPMVALECQLPMSGRLSPPPADLNNPARSMASPPCEPALIANTDLKQYCNAINVPSAEGTSDPVSIPTSHHDPQQGAHHHHFSRPGMKRKLPRREYAVCEDDDYGFVVGRQQGSSQNHSQADTDTWHRAQCDTGERAAKRIQLEVTDGNVKEFEADCEQVFVGLDCEAVTTGAEGSDSDEQRMDDLTCDVTCVVEHAADTMCSDLHSVSADIQCSPSLDAVVEETPDCIVEVDVVGDDEEITISTSAYPFTSSTTSLPPQHDCHHDHASTQLLDDQPADHELGSGGEEVSSEEGEDETFLTMPRPPRISPFLNTPKQRKEERRKILKLSIHKMRAVEDPEHFLRRSVLINNTMKRLQRELREEKMRNNPRRNCYGLYRRASSLHYDVLNNSYLLHDEPFAISDNDRITDDMTDALVTRLEATSSPVMPTPSHSPTPVDEPDTVTSSSEEFCRTSALWSAEVTSTVSELCPPSPAAYTSASDSIIQPSSTSSEPLMPPILQSVPDTLNTTVSTTSAADLMPSLSQPSSSSPSPASSPSPSILYEGVFSVPGMACDAQSPGSSCSSESHREKQLYADIDSVFNNLIHALGDS